MAEQGNEKGKAGRTTLNAQQRFALSRWCDENKKLLVRNNFTVLAGMAEIALGFRVTPAQVSYVYHEAMNLPPKTGAGKTAELKERVQALEERVQALEERWEPNVGAGVPPMEDVPGPWAIRVGAEEEDDAT